MIKAKTFQNDTSISQIFFAIAPFQISFSSPLNQTLIVYLEKGLQIIGSLKYPLLPNRQTNISIPFNDNILQFRIFYDKNTQYQWSIYKRLEDDSQQLIQTQKFSLKDIWKTVSQNKNLQQNKQRSFTQTQKFSFLKMNLSFYVFAAQSQQFINDQIMIKLNPEVSQNLTQKSTQPNAKKLTKRTSLLKSDSIKSDKKISKSNIQTIQKGKQMNQNKSHKSLIAENEIKQEKNSEKQIIQEQNIVQKNIPLQQKEQSVSQSPIKQEKVAGNQNLEEVVETINQQPSSKDILIESQVEEVNKVQRITNKVKQSQEKVKIVQQQQHTQQLRQNVESPEQLQQTQQQNKHIDNQNTIQPSQKQPTISLQTNSEVLEARSKKIAIIFLIILIIIGFGGYQFLPKSLKKKELKGVNKFKKNRK